MKTVIITSLIAAAISMGTAKAQSSYTWSSQTSGVTTSLNSVHFPSNSTGFTVGDNNTALKTTNGGNNWIACYPGRGQTYNGVFFTSDMVGYIAADSGLVLKTEDGGMTWAAQQPDGVFISWKDIFFYDANNGWIVGPNGSGLRTTNAGSSWTPYGVGGSQHLYGVHFISPTHGCACGQDNAIFCTTNGGQNWTQSTVNGLSFALYLNSIRLASPTVAYAVGSSGTMLKSLNGGASWDTVTSGTTNHLRDIYLGAFGVGAAVGQNQTIMETNESVTGWFNTMSGTRELNSVFFTNETRGFAVGDSGLILATNSTAGTETLIPTTSPLLAYPNPSDGQFYLSSDLQADLNIFNSQGQLVLSRRVSEGVNPVNMPELAPGIYLLELRSEQYIRKGKIVIR